MFSVKGNKVTIHSHEQKRSSRPMFVYRNDSRPPSVILKEGFTGTKQNTLWNAKWAKHVVPTAGSKRGLRYYAHELGRSKTLQHGQHTIHQYEINATGMNHVNLRDYVKTNQHDVMKGHANPYEDTLTKEKVRALKAKDKKEGTFEQKKKDGAYKDYSRLGYRHVDTYADKVDPKTVDRMMRDTVPQHAGAKSDYTRELRGNVHHNHEVTLLEQVPGHKIRYLGAVTIDNINTKVAGLQTFMTALPKDKRTMVDKEQAAFRKEHGTSRPNIASRKAKKESKKPVKSKPSQVTTLPSVNLSFGSSTVKKSTVKPKPKAKAKSKVEQPVLKRNIEKKEKAARKKALAKEKIESQKDAKLTGVRKRYVSPPGSPATGRK